MKILILGAGKMGLFFADLLAFDHDVAVYDTDPRRLRFTFNVRRFTSLDEVDAFAPDMVLNAATVKYTIEAFEAVLPHVAPNTMLSDIASVKTGLPEFYTRAGHPFVSTHPMFGPTFASLSNLADENAIIIKESDRHGQEFFRNLYHDLDLHIVDYTFEEHDETVAYSLTIPFTSTLVFSSVMKPQDAPGTTFKRHLAIARGLMSEDDYLLTEILFNPHSVDNITRIENSLAQLKDIITRRDPSAMKIYLARVRANLRHQPR